MIKRLDDHFSVVALPVHQRRYRLVQPHHQHASGNLILLRNIAVGITSMKQKSGK